jgi:hypothetical protein
MSDSRDMSDSRASGGNAFRRVAIDRGDSRFLEGIERFVVHQGFLSASQQVSTSARQQVSTSARQQVSKSAWRRGSVAAGGRGGR